ncbi:hypothetical protein Tco_0875761 [Tanacetum coccineum]|uniref:Uncharacterized protein n=1 Tax=Tanacetum coccineum TaxID=301880 RepID=A0ABQ5BQF5_9ASTR
MARTAENQIFAIKNSPTLKGHFISHMLKVAKLSTTELEKSLLVSFEEMNTDSTADKSLSRTAMQCSGQKKTVTETQHAEEPVATVDTTQSLEASESAEEVANQPKPTTINAKEVDSDLDSMPDYEIMSISGDDDDEASSDRELFVVNEVDANNLINKVVTEINTEDTTKIISDASNTEALGAIRRFKEIQITKAHGSDPLGHLPRRMDILVAQIQNLTKSLLDTFNEKMNSAASTALKLVSDALAQQLPDLLTVTLKHNLPQMITNSMIDTLHGFNWRIRNAIKDEMHAVLKTSVLKSMYKEFNALNKLDTSRFVMLEKRVHQSVHKHVRVKMSMIDGPLRLLEAKMDKTSADMTVLVGLLSRVVKLIDYIQHTRPSPAPSSTAVQNLLLTSINQRSYASDDQTSLALVVHPTAEIHEELPRKRIKVVMEIPTIPTLVLLNSIRPTIFDSIHYDQFIANLFGYAIQSTL